MKQILSVLSLLFFSVVIHGQVIQASGPTSFCSGGNVVLTVSPITGITAYQWVNNGANVGTNAAGYTASTTGNYSVKLTRSGLSDTTIGPISVTVFALPVISLNPIGICIGQPKSLTASGADTYSWSPATGLSATTGSIVTANPVITTTYTITGRNTTTGCTNTGTATITVNPFPTADFTSAPTGLCSSVPVVFTNTSTGGATYSWNFGDPNSGSSNTSTAKDPTHKFVGNPGNVSQNFNVTLSTTSAAGCTTTTTLSVTNKQSPDRTLGGTGKALYNGETYFKTCGLTNGIFTFTNQSSQSNNTDYRIVWGDGSPDFNSSTFASVSHTYAVGPHPMLYIVTGNTGCTDTTKYFAFVGTNPAVGLENPGNTTTCGGASLTFPITGTSTNAPGTIYSVTFNDGSAPLIFVHPDVPSSVTHIFDKSSCGTTSSNGTSTYFNSFSASIVATNPCLSSAATVVPIHVSKKPTASFNISPGDTVCINNVTTFINTSLNSYVDNGSCLIGNAIWSITPATGWTVNNGSFLGNDFGLPDPSVWQNGSNSLEINFTVPGIYSIKIRTGSTKDCGTDEFTRTICVTSPPLPAFTLNSQSGCIPFTVNSSNTTNLFNSCQTAKYFWSVSFAAAFCGNSSSWGFAPGSTATSISPTFIFNNPGIYAIQLSVSNACGTFTTTQTVDVKKPPTVTITPPSYPCGPVTITPVAIVSSCSTTTPTYLWTFDGGIPATSVTKDPGPISFTAVGTHAISMVVTNECGTTTALASVIVSAAPNVVVPGDTLYCGGQTTGAFNFSSTVGAPTYNWTNNNTAIGLPASGTGNISSFTATNNSSTPLTAVITVTPFGNALCSGIPISFKITVNPRPAAPLVVTPVVYCLNAAAIPLTATSASGNSLTWYNNIVLTGGTATAYTPSTSTAGTASFYVTQTNSFLCQSPAGVINVTVNPSIAGNTIAKDDTICANTVPATLTTMNVVSGGSGSFTYQWQRSTDGTTWTNIAGATNPSYSPPALSITTVYRRLINSSACADTSNLVTITVQGALVNFGIAANHEVCESIAPALLTGQLPTGGGGTYSYLWESSTDNINWVSTNGTGIDYQPAGLLQTTYFRRRVIASQCSAVSNVVIITVNPTPKAVITTGTPSICEYNAAGVSFTATTGAAPFTIELTVTRPDGTDSIISQTINSNGPVNINVIPANSAPGNYTIVLKKITDTKGCINNSVNISTVMIEVKPRPVLIVSAPATICNGTSTNLTVSGATIYQWSPATGLSSTSGNSVIASPISTITYTVTGTLNGCISSATIPVTVTPGTTIANAGTDQVLCNVNTATLAANIAATGTGSWAQVSGSTATITDNTLNNSTVTGLKSGERYVFQWTITGLPPCPPTVSNVTIDVLSPVVNTIKKDSIICNGQSVVLQTLLLSGGKTNGLDSLYSYQWEMASPAQNNWQPITGATQETFNASPANSTCYRRKVKTNNSCETASNTICITVNPNIGNNTISSSTEVCVNITPALITGTQPTGGDNSYIYQWQTSTDGTTWTDIANSLNYQPPVYSTSGKHFFRRNVTSGNCTSVSNVFIITVRPDSKAIFISNPVIACAPFDLSKAINVAALPDSNGLYQWFANGNSIGSNTTGNFPGYTIANPADTVIIKLKTSSQFGCKPDSMDQQFITVITAVAKFSKDTSFGCGPLPVNFTNTSNLLNGIQFFWDFGNGVKSNLVQPGIIIFKNSPFFNDTTYHITLRAYNGCDTTIWRDSVKVRANPKARFGVDTTFGCSPFTILITNTSPGGPNAYYWDFGNGKKDTTYTNGSFNYTYNIGKAVDTFTVRLIAENQCSRDTQSINVRVAPNIIKPLINVNSSQLFGCAPHIVLFSNNTSGATSYTWNFGDNTGAVVTNNNQNTVLHTYNTAGVFTVSVDITNGCSDTTVYRQVTVYAKPVAAFTTSASVYCEGDTIRVTNNSTNANNYRWFWGDGTSDGGTRPVHVYPVAGNYNILLRAEIINASGTVCFDTLVLPVTVLAKPVVTIQSNINAINCAPFKLIVTAPGIINESVTWYFYDSTVSPSIVISNVISAQYTFNKPGSFYAKLVVENAAGCKDSAIIRFTVRGKAVASFTPFNLAVCTRDTTVNYINTTTYNGNNPISYRWLVDNVLISTGANFSYRYNVLPNAVLPRMFNTKLVVSNTVGCSDTASATLQMNPVAKAQFSISNPNACVPFKPLIVDASAYTTTYRWLVNGVLVSTSPDPGIVITKASTVYTITLVADNVFGCKPDTFSITFTSRVRPVAAFRLNDTLGCTGVLNVVTSNLTTGASSYVWNWGDASANSPFPNPTHLYTTPGQYLITLVASDGVCTDTTSKLVKVSLKPVANFAASQTVTCDTARVQFTNLTINGTTYVWSFGDGTNSNFIDPVKSFAPGIVPYTVKLVASSTFGCKDSIIKPNLVLAKVPPAADFFISPNPVITVPNYTFNFNNLTLNSANYKYQWSLGDGTFARTRDVTHKYVDTGNYPIRLIVLDTATNCADTTTKIARIDGFPGYLYVPNAICPNCIQSNLREFLPKGIGLKEYRLQIYTTWNELIFETRLLDNKGAPTQAWDGKFKGTIVQQDVYVWRIDAKFLNGSEWLGMIYPGENKYKKAGTITVVK